jgi:hypothetical protein
MEESMDDFKESLNEEVFEQPSAESLEMDNKYNRNVLLVLDCVITGLKGLFSEEEIRIYEAYKGCDPLAQTVFARMITRKR